MNKNRLNHIANFIEELSWLLESNKDLSLKEVSDNLRNLTKNRSNRFYSNMDISSSKEGKSFLVGILPKILQDNDLFKTNSEMLDFAEQVLKLNPSRASKRSRIEYIGWIVCEVSNTKSENLESLYSYLKNVFSDETKIKEIKQAKKSKEFSWNEIIRNL